MADGDEDNEAGLGGDVDADADLGAGDLGGDDDAPTETELETEQRRHGWTNEEEFVEKGGDAKDHLSAKQYAFNGRLLSQIGKLEAGQKDSAKEISDATLFLRTQNSMLRNQLEIKKTKQIKEGDVEGVAETDKQLADIPTDKKEDPAEAKAADDNLLAEWKGNNAWVFDESSAKFKEANNHFRVCAAKKMSMQESLDSVDELMGKSFPTKSGDVNTRRNEKGGLGDSGGKGGGGGKKAKMIPRSQLTFEERLIADDMEGRFKPEEINQMIVNSREPLE